MVFIIQTVAELFLSPVGLSTMSALAPKSFASQTMRWNRLGGLMASPSAATSRMYSWGATDVFGGPHEIRECSRHLAVIASASSSKQLT